MMVKFNFNNGESKRLDKPLANLLASRGEGHIDGFEGVEKQVIVPENKEDKVIKRRAKK
jgi:hypothetical protein